MNLLKILLPILFLSPVFLLGQASLDCDALLRKPLAYDVESKEWDQEPFLEDAANLLQCFFDVEEQAYLINRPFRNFLFELATQDWEYQPTHQDMFDYFEKFMAQKKQEDLAEAETGEKTFGNTIADTSTFRQDLLLIDNFQPSKKLVHDIYELTIEYQGKGMTYGELIDIYKIRNGD